MIPRAVLKVIVLIWLLLLTDRAVADVYFLDNGNLKEVSARNGNSPRNFSINSQFSFLFDLGRSQIGPVFLLSKTLLQQDPDIQGRPRGYDLWFVDDQGGERRVCGSVFRARLSKDNKLIVYTTSGCDLNVETVSGTNIVNIKGAYDPSWKTDSKSIVLSRSDESSDDLQHPRALQVCVLDIISRHVTPLTDGLHDDVRPEFSPSGDWVLFVSGVRSGFASFWKVPVSGGNPVQLTNVSLPSLTEKFVPTPYLNTLWSGDGRWFIYDFKNGDVEETWGLELTEDGKLLRAVKLADGLSPQLLADGHTLVTLRHVNDQVTPQIRLLP